MTSFEEIFHSSDIMLTEAAIVERLKNEYQLPLDTHLNHAALIYKEPEVLRELFQSYINVAETYNLSLLLCTSTRRLNRHSLKAAGYTTQLIADNCAFLKDLRAQQFRPDQIFIGALMGCKGDAYSAAGGLNRTESEEFHRPTALLYAEQEVDFLMAPIMPQLDEARGMAQAMAASGLPYIINFMIRKDGKLLDGTAIADAIASIDQTVEHRPLCYMTNCIHPTNLLQAIKAEANTNRPEMKRFMGIQANASTLSPEELDNCSMEQKEDLGVLVQEMIKLYKNYQFKIFGGCCGTNHAFLTLLAQQLTLELKK